MPADVAERVVELFVSGESINHTVFLLNYEWGIDQVSGAIREKLRGLMGARPEATAAVNPVEAGSKHVTEATTEVPFDMCEVAAEIRSIEARLTLLRGLKNCDFQPTTSMFVSGLFTCSRCGSETANLPLYADSVCSVRVAAEPEAKG